MPPFSATVTAGSEPAGGAATSEIAIATGMAVVVTGALIALCAGHRSGRLAALGWTADLAARLSGLPRHVALPLGLGGGALNVALLGMYWDISLHIDNGRDAGPLANPAHYLILIGLFGIFAAGIIAISLPIERRGARLGQRGRKRSASPPPDGERPGPRSVRIAEGWHAPIGGLLMAAAGAFALTGFPLDDLWHRLFGQDVTLWGPTHLMLIGGAGMSLIGMCVLLAESNAGPAGATLRKMGLMGGLLIGLSTFQGEFDFGVPQFRMVFHPMLISLAAAFALVAARLWIGRGGALLAALFFLFTRGWVTLLVGPVFGETAPAMALYVPEAILIEVLALALIKRPLAFGATAGVLTGTIGMAAEWGWTSAVFRLPWTVDILPEATAVAVVAGVAGGTFGALLGTGLRGDLVRPQIARPAAGLALVAVAVVVANGLITDNDTGASATVTGNEVRITPDIADGAAWATVTGWQGQAELYVDRLDRVGPGVYRLDGPPPTTGTWKAMLRVQSGRAVVSAPIRLPADAAIPAPAVPVTSEPRPFVADKLVLQREQKAGVAPWLKTAGPLVVLMIALGFAGALSWGVARIGRTAPAAKRPRAAAPPSAATPLPS